MWIIFALGASIFWGITYALNEEIYKKISVSTYLAIASLFIFITTLFISYFSDTLKSDLLSIASSKRLLLYVGLGIVGLIAAELLIGSSIHAKNATLAGLIEISYPLFIALFSYIFFKHSITIPTIVGGVIIFAGIFVIYYFNH